MDSRLGDIGAFRSNASTVNSNNSNNSMNLGLARRARGPEAPASLGEHRQQDFFFIERDQGLSTSQPSILVSTAYTQLQPEHQTLYRNLLWYCQSDATASSSLASLLTDRKLTPAVMNELTALVQSPMAQGLDRGQIIKETLLQLNDPMRVDQGTRSTCTAAVVQYLSIKQQPDRYVAMIAGLVSPSGQAKLPGGGTISRVGSLSSDGTDRSMVDQLVQNALMTYATGSYNPVTDRNGDNSVGLTAQRFDHLIEGVMNDSYSTMQIDESFTAEQALIQLKQSTARGEQVPVGLQWKSGGHKILIQRFDQGLVFYFNPWGRMESMTEAELLSRIHNVSFK